LEGSNTGIESRSTSFSFASSGGGGDEAPFGFGEEGEEGGGREGRGFSECVEVEEEEEGCWDSASPSTPEFPPAPVVAGRAAPAPANPILPLFAIMTPAGFPLLSFAPPALLEAPLRAETFDESLLWALELRFIPSLAPPAEPDLEFEGDIRLELGEEGFERVRVGEVFDEFEEVELTRGRALASEEAVGVKREREEVGEVEVEGRD